MDFPPPAGCCLASARGLLVRPTTAPDRKRGSQPHQTAVLPPTMTRHQRRVLRSSICLTGAADRPRKSARVIVGLATQTRSSSRHDVRGKQLCPARPLITADQDGDSAAGIDFEQYLMTRVLVSAVGPEDAHRDRVAVRPESV